MSFYIMNAFLWFIMLEIAFFPVYYSIEFVIGSNLSSVIEKASSSVVSEHATRLLSTLNKDATL